MSALALTLGHRAYISGNTLLPVLQLLRVVYTIIRTFVLIVPECTIEGQVFTACGTACPPTCTNQPLRCTLQCVAECQCPIGTVLDEVNNRCVEIQDCRMYNNITITY